MTQKKSDAFIEEIPAYVLGALDRAEASALKKHLGTCQVCQSELAHYQEIGDGLMVAVPLQAPSSAVKGKLLARVDGKIDSVRLKFQWGIGKFATAMIVLVLMSANLIAFLQIHHLRQQQTQLVSQMEKNRTILGMLAASTEVHPVSGSGFTGNLLLDREKNLSYLLAWNLPAPPNDSIYQIWLVSPEGERIDAGTFRPEVDGQFTSTALNTSRNFTEFVGIEVTIEPRGGSTNPTGEQILNATY